MKHYKNALPNRCDFLFRLRASCVFITCVFTDLLMLKSLIVKLFVFMIYIHSSYCLFDNCVFYDLPRPSPINFPKIFLLKLGHEDKIIFRLKNYSFNTILFFGTRFYIRTWLECAWKPQKLHFYPCFCMFCPLYIVFFLIWDIEFF